MSIRNFMGINCDYFSVFGFCIRYPVSLLRGVSFIKLKGMNYSKTNFPNSLTLFFITTLIISCSPEPPGGPPPTLPPNTYWRHLDNISVLTAAAQVGKTNQAIPICENPGQSCIVTILPQPPQPPIGIPVSASILNFRNYYNNNNVAGYFNNDPTWASVFPQLSLNTVALAKIKSGEYHTWMPVANAVVFYDGQFVGAGNFSLGFVWK